VYLQPSQARVLAYVSASPDGSPDAVPRRWHSYIWGNCQCDSTGNWNPQRGRVILCDLLKECSFTSAERRDGVLCSRPLLYTHAHPTSTPQAGGDEKDVGAGVDHHVTQNRGWCKRLNPGTPFQNAAQPQNGLDESRFYYRRSEDTRAHVERSDFFECSLVVVHTSLCCEFAESVFWKQTMMKQFVKAHWARDVY
jgi:hypothetical protein